MGSVRWPPENVLTQLHKRQPGVALFALTYLALHPLIP
jgi:hypothetical protein